MSSYDDLLALALILREKGIINHLESMRAEKAAAFEHEQAAKQALLAAESLQANIHSSLRDKTEQLDAHALEAKEKAESMLRDLSDKRAALDRHAEQMVKQADELARRLAELDGQSHHLNVREQELNVREHVLGKRETSLKIAQDNLHQRVTGGLPDVKHEKAH